MLGWLRKRQGHPERGPQVGGEADVETLPPVPSATLAAGAAPSLAADAGELWRLAWPVMLSQALVTGVSLADLAMVGRLGPGAMAAVGYATQFFFMTQAALLAVGFACVALMARAIGAGRPAEARHALGAAIVVAVTTAFVVAAAVLAAPRTILSWLNAEPAVVELSVPYLRMVLGSSLLLAASLMVESGLRADRDTVTPMRVAVFVAALKVSLSAVLIFGLLGLPRLELVGAGLATVASQLAGLLVYGAIVLRAPATSPIGLRAGDLRGGRRLVPAVVRLALPSVGERVLLNLALLTYFALLGRYGTVAVAAYTVGVRALSFSWIPGMAIGAAVATLVGQALGRGDEQEAERVGKRAARLAVAIALVLGTAAGIERLSIARLFTSDPETIATLGPFLLCLAFAQPMLQLHFTLAGIHRGAGDTWTPMVAAAVGNWGLRVPIAAIASLLLHADLVWVWAALVVDHTARALWLGLSLRRGRWKHRLEVAVRKAA
ncbi:MAG: MATE family efflux transporter [Candidatus Dadabacteria bacterium]|nr:MAG: MATE family efflux transporter [Candidatus Dadabacteria bacterium]